MRKVFVEPISLPEPRFRDGLGIRYVRTDSGEDPVEVLRPLWEVAAMRAAIQSRVDRLASFRQARFVRVRATEVPPDDPSTIEVVSDYVSGHRLSELLEAARTGAVRVELNAAVHIIRELLGALAVLHESRGVTHGAIAPERILLTPKGRIVVADYVLGAAIERLEYARGRLWREFRIPMPPGKKLARFDDLADVMQVGVTALALLVGRPIEGGEYPNDLAGLVASAGKTSGHDGRQATPAPLLTWLKRTIQHDQGGRFANVREARMALETVVSKQRFAVGGAAALQLLAEAYERRVAAAEQAAASVAAARRSSSVAEIGPDAAGDESARHADGDHSPGVEPALGPVFTLLVEEAPEATGAEGGEESATFDAALAAVSETEQAVGWRVPETPTVEEPLPTSPLLELELAAAATDQDDDFSEEVLDLGELVDDSHVAGSSVPSAVLAGPEAVTVAPLQMELPDEAPTQIGGLVDHAEDLPTLLVGESDAVGATAEPVLVEAPPVMIDAPREARPQPSPLLQAEPPAAVEVLTRSFVDQILDSGAGRCPESAAVEAGADGSSLKEQAVVFSILQEDAPPAGEPTRAEPPTVQGSPAQSFVEEVLTLREWHDEQAAVVAALPDAFPVEKRSVAAELLQVETPPAAAEPPLAALAGEVSSPATVRSDDFAAIDAPPPRTGLGGEGEIRPALPADWFIGVNVAATRRTAPEMPETAAISGTPPTPVAGIAKPLEPAQAEIVPPPRYTPPVPVLAREADPAPSRSRPSKTTAAGDTRARRGAVRVAPSIQRVRAANARRRLTRVHVGLTIPLRAIGGACRAGLHGVHAAGALAARGAARMFAASASAVGGVGRATAAAGAASVSLVVWGVRVIGRSVGRLCLAVLRTLADAGTWAASAGRAVASNALAASIWSLRAAAHAGLDATVWMIALVGRSLAGTAGAARVGVSTVTLGLARALGGLAKAVGTGLASALSVASLVARGGGRAAARTGAVTGSVLGGAARGAVRLGRGLAAVVWAVPRRALYVAADLTDAIPRPVVRPAYLAVALLAIVAVAGVPYARSRWFSPPPKVGTLRVESARPGLTVRIDGVEQGPAPLSATLAPGPHRVEVDGGGRTRVHDIVLTEGHETVVQASGEGVFGAGSIHVASEPDGAEVWLDGVLHGTAPLTMDNVAEGPHTVLVRAASGSVRQVVRVRADEIAEATIQIRPGWLAVFAPVRLDILEDGRVIGTTERGRILANPGEHTLELVSRAIGFRETRRTYVTPGQVAALTVQMPPVTLEIVAPVDAEIWIDGQSIGKAPIQPVSVAVGTREVLMRHPTLGERKQVITLTYGNANRVVFEEDRDRDADAPAVTRDAAPRTG